MTGQRLRRGAILTPLLSGALALLAWTQSWVILQLDDGPAVTAAGDVAATTLPALALATLAIGAVLPLVTPAVARIVGAVEILLGVGIVTVAAGVVADPVGRGAAAVTAVTGVAGSDGVAALVADVSLSVWVVVAIAAGLLAVVGGLVPVTTARRWPARSRRYDAQDARGPVDEDRLGEWDALSDGDDPTAR